MRLTRRGQIVFGMLFIIGMIFLMSLAGAIETQDVATCEDYQASQDWEKAWDKGCPFQDGSGNYLYTWEPNTQ